MINTRMFCVQHSHTYGVSSVVGESLRKWVLLLVEGRPVFYLVGYRILSWAAVIETRVEAT